MGLYKVVNCWPFCNFLFLYYIHNLKLLPLIATATSKAASKPVKQQIRMATNQACNVYTLPYEIRARIWASAATKDSRKQTNIECCKPQSHPSRHTRCIKSFTEIFDTIDPLDVTRYASSNPTYAFRFCSTNCFKSAMRLANPSQRRAFSRGKVRIPYSKADIRFINSAPGETIPGWKLVQGRVGDVWYQSPDEEEDDAEGRIAEVREKMFKELRKVGRKHFDIGGGLIACWSAKDGGMGWVEMTL